MSVLNQHSSSPTTTLEPPKTDPLENILERIQRLTNGAASCRDAESDRPPVGAAAGRPSNSSSNAQPSGDTPDAVPPPPSGTPPYLKVTGKRDEPMLPIEPQSLAETGVSDSMLEELVMRFLFSRGESTGRGIAEQVKLPFRLVEPLLHRLKAQQLIAYAGATTVSDYVHVMTDAGRDRAKRYLQKTTYFGSAPVRFQDYVTSVKLQSVEHQHPSREDLRKAFSDLLISPQLLARLGPAINSGRGMFLYGYPGNGKTSIAERVTRTFGEYIWIPRAILVETDIIRVFDPMMHESAEPEASDGLLDSSHIDRRWIRIKRPTVVAGGELTMSMLEVAHNPESNTNDSPLQIKSNCGVLLIDDFGRQRVTVDELLNRWIVPLEKRYDYLSLFSGKKIQVPFDQLVIFSTNLEPKKLVDDAFLRRIPYKIEVQNPSEEAFRKLFEIMCRVIKIPYRADMIDYLIQKHYKPFGRPFRNCHPRDLLLQVRSFCYYNGSTMELKPEYLDFAVENYFSIM
ncbi:MAG: AAA family ATPase [Pirellulaceae bacterium]|nr:AAA family ATPase [Pirellulaceae bacterium]